MNGASPAGVAWLAEEVGELAQALRKGSVAQQRDEFADVLAWVATLANIAGVDLEAALGGTPTAAPSVGACPATAERIAPVLELDSRHPSGRSATGRGRGGAGPAAESRAGEIEQLRRRLPMTWPRHGRAPGWAGPGRPPATAAPSSPCQELLDAVEHSPTTTAARRGAG